MKNLINRIIAFFWGINKNEWISLGIFMLFSLGFPLSGVFQEHPIFYFWCMTLFVVNSIYAYRRGINDSSELWESAFIKEFFKSRNISEVRAKEISDTFDKNNSNLNGDQS